MADQRLDWAEGTRDVVIPRSSKPKKHLWEEIDFKPICSEEVVVQLRRPQSEGETEKRAQ